MSIIWCVFWGVLTLGVIFGTIKYYLPKLSLRTGMMMHSGVTTIPPVMAIVVVIGCTIFAAICGYVASEYSMSTISLLKMTLTFGVLVCVCITDLELMIIPNTCSLILLGGRVMTIIAEFIFNNEFAMQWLVNSIVAMLISLIMLFILSKVTNGGIGLGDVKLFGSLGFLCGIRAVSYTLVLAFFVCALISTFFLLTKKKQLKDSLPLGPFIWIGYGISILLGCI